MFVNGIRYLSYLLLSASLTVSAIALANDSLSPSVAQIVQPKIEQALKACANSPATFDTFKNILCSGQIRFGVRTNYKSFGELDGDKNVGFEIDLATAIAKVLGVNPVFVPVAPADRIAFLLEKKVDVVLATMAHTTTRAAVVEFVRPHYYSSGTAVIGSRFSDVTSMRDLAAKSICVPLGSYANMLISESQARLLIFSRPSAMVSALQYGACALIAHDESLMFASVTGPNAPEELRTKFEKKFSFADVPWGMAVRPEDAQSLGYVLSHIVADFHANGRILDLASKNNIPIDFLAAQRSLWSDPRCGWHDRELNGSCFLPAAHVVEPATSIAPQVEAFQSWLLSRFGFKISFPILAGETSRSLFLQGVLVSLILVVLSVMSTLLCALALYRTMVARGRVLRVAGNLISIALLNSPTILLLVLGYLIATSFVEYGLMASLLIAALAIGMNNGANGAQALIDVDRLSPDRTQLSKLVVKTKVQLRACVINAAKTSPVAAFIGTPELLSSLTNIASFTGERQTTYWVVTFFYIAVVQGVIVLSAHIVDRQ